MYEVIFLWILALVYITFAVIQDIRTREIANWLNFSLVIFALGFRFFYSLFNGGGFSFFYSGIIGFGIFFIIGNLFYYGRIFAGGDAKLMISLGAILPIYSSLSLNVKLFFNFLFLFLIIGFVYLITTSFILCIRNFKAFRKQLSNQLKRKKRFMCFILFFSVIFLSLGFLEKTFFIFGLFVFFVSYLYIASKAIDEACMVKKIKTKYLREGDWLYSDVKIGKKIIKAKWDGVTKKEIKELSKKYREVRIRNGVPFSPVFLISLIIFAFLIFFNISLWNPFW